MTIAVADGLMKAGLEADANAIRKQVVYTMSNVIIMLMREGIVLC